MRHSPKGTIDDVRMRGFVRRQTVEAALSWLDAQLHVLDAEPVPLREAAGRVLATSVVIGDSMPGRPFEGSVLEGQAVRVMTGAPMPPGTDAVLPAEWAAAEPTTAPGATPGCIGALMAMSPGKNVGKRGEDIGRGAPVLEAGRVLRPQDVGVLSSIGYG